VSSDDPERRDCGSFDGDPSLLVVDSGYELVRPSFKRTIVHEDVDPPLLWNLDPAAETPPTD